MTRAGHSIFLLTFVLGACVAADGAGAGAGADGEGGGGKADDGDELTRPFQRVDRDLIEAVRDTYCAGGNGEVEVGTYDREAFEASAVAAYVRARDADKGCPDRRYSWSRASGVAAFDAFRTEYAEPINEYCSDSDVPLDGDQVFARMASLIADPSNVAVFSTEHDDDGTDDPVSCFYYSFWVFRADGSAAYLDYNWAD